MILLNHLLEYCHIILYLNEIIDSSIHKYDHSKCLLIIGIIINLICKVKKLFIYILLIFFNIYIFLNFPVYCVDYYLIKILILELKKFLEFRTSFCDLPKHTNLFYFGNMYSLILNV